MSSIISQGIGQTKAQNFWKVTWFIMWQDVVCMNRDPFFTGTEPVRKYVNICTK